MHSFLYSAELCCPAACPDWPFVVDEEAVGGFFPSEVFNLEEPRMLKEESLLAASAILTF